MYFRALTEVLDTLPVQGVKAITYITTCQDKQSVLTLLCSLLNTASILRDRSHDLGTVLTT